MARFGRSHPFRPILQRAVIANEGVASTVCTSTANAIPPAFMRPASDIAANGWQASTGPDLYAMLDELVLDTGDYIYSPDNPTTQQFEVKLSSGSDPLLSVGHIIRVALEAVGADTNFDLDLVQGTTVLDSWTENVTVAAGVVTRTRTFSGAVADSITNYGDVRVRGVARA